MEEEKAVAAANAVWLPNTIPIQNPIFLHTNKEAVTADTSDLRASIFLYLLFPKRNDKQKSATKTNQNRINAKTLDNAM